MALTPLRWIAAAIAGGLLVAGMMFRTWPQSRRVYDPRQDLAARASSVSSSAARAAEHLRVMLIRDSVSARLARLPRPDASRVIVDDAIQGRLPRTLAILTSRASSYRAAEPRVPVDIVFVLDTASRVRGVSRAAGGLLVLDYLLPHTAQDRCVVLARVRPPANDVRMIMAADRAGAFMRSSFVNRLLGPCAFVERFGMPGPAIDAWLMNGAWSYGLLVRWDRPQMRWRPGWAAPDFRNDAAGWPFRYWIGTDGYRCVAGSGEACERVLANEMPSEVPGHADILRSARIVGVPRPWELLWQRRPLGPHQPYFLSDMVREIGPQRFLQFWTSQRPAPEAFREATGMPLGQWTSRWGTAVYGAVGTGPGLDGQSVLLALGLVAVSAAGAGVAARRRQVR